MIRPAKLTDAKPIATIYNHYIQHSIATFEENTVTPGEMEKRIDNTNASGFPWLIAENDGHTIIGYAYANQWKARSAYQFSAEVTVYLSPTTTAQGWGTQLYTALFSALKQKSIHTVIGGISLPNPASIRLHEKLGLQKIAHFQEVGYKFNQWIDVGYWQKTLE